MDQPRRPAGFGHALDLDPATASNRNVDVLATGPHADAHVAGGAADAADQEDGFLDFETATPDKLNTELVEMMSKIPVKKGGAMVVYGWTMAEDLVKLGKR